MARLIDAAVALVLPLVVELNESLKEFLELRAVIVDRLNIHERTHVGSARWISDHARAAAEKNYRRVAELLHIHDYDNLHEMSHVEAVRSRIKADIELNLLVLQKPSDLLLVSGLLNQPPFLQDIIYVIALTYIIRN